MKIEYIIDQESTIKEFIYKNISRNFFGYLKEHDVIYLVDGVNKKSYDEVHPNERLEIIYQEEKNQEGILSSL